MGEEGLAEYAAGDKYGVAGGVLEHMEGGARVEDVSIAGNGYGFGGKFCIAYDIAVGFSVVALLSCSPVDGDEGCAGALSCGDDLACVDGVVVPADANLDRNGYFDGADDVREDLTDALWVAKETGSAAIFCHLVNGAAAVEIDDIEAELFDDPGRGGGKLRL